MFYSFNFPLNAFFAPLRFIATGECIQHLLLEYCCRISCRCCCLRMSLPAHRLHHNLFKRKKRLVFVWIRQAIQFYLSIVFSLMTLLCRACVWLVVIASRDSNSGNECQLSHPMNFRKAFFACNSTGNSVLGCDWRSQWASDALWFSLVLVDSPHSRWIPSHKNSSNLINLTARNAFDIINSTLSEALN